MNKKIIRIIIGAAVLLLFVLLCISSLLSNHVAAVPEGSVGNTAGNANNGGYFCEYDGKVYFSNAYDNGSLYIMNPDESGIKKLSSVSASHINAGGDYLFYYQQESSGASGLGYARTAKGIFRSNLKGEKAVCLAREYAFNLQLVGNSLYYLTSDDRGSAFYRLSTDKEEQTLLARETRNFACADENGTVYYNGDDRNHYLYRYNTSTGTSELIWEGNLWYPVYRDDYIYFLDVSSNYRLCRYSLREQLVEVLTHDRVDCFNIGGDYIYYQKNSATEPALMRMRLDGQDVETVATGNYTHIQITSEYVYFNAFETEVPVYRTSVNGPVNVTAFTAAMEAALSQAAR